MHHVREAERILLRPANGRFHAWILTVHGEVLVGQRQWGEAKSVLERALALFDQAPDPSNQAIAMWMLARALRGQGNELGRVRRLAEAADGLFAKLSAAEARNRDAVQKFLSELSAVAVPSSATSATKPSSHESETSP